MNAPRLRRLLLRPALLAVGFFGATLGVAVVIDLWLLGSEWVGTPAGLRHTGLNALMLGLVAGMIGWVLHREQRRAGVALQRERAEAARLQSMYEDSPVATLIWETDSGLIRSANRAARELFSDVVGGTALVGLRIYDIRPVSGHAELHEAIAGAGGGTVSGVWTHRRTDGTTFDARVYAHPIQIEGRWARIVFLHNLTAEQVRLEEAHKEADRRVREIVERLHEGFLVLDRSGRVRFANRPGAAFLGAASPSAAVAGAVVEDEALRSAVAAVAQNGKSAQLEVFRPHGDRSYDVRLFPVPDGVGAVITETTGQRRMQRDLERARDHALAAVRAKSEFLAVMSHEIRTPLNSVLGFSELLLETPLDGEQQEFVMMVRSNGRILLELIEEILDFSKMEAGKFQLVYAPFGLVAALEEARQRVEALAHQKRLQLRLEVGPGVPEGVVGDEFSVLKVVGNLLSNAIKFTERGDVVLRIELQPPPSDHPADERVWVRLTVRDSGIGIPLDVREHLFEPFVQANTSTKRQYGGTGLGLAICRRLVSQMGGRIWLDDAVGPGATFHAEMPFLVADFDAPEPTPVADPGLRDFAAHHPLRILVAEDVPASQRLLGEWLRRFGYDPEVAADGVEALAYLRAQPWDLVLLDVAMPKLDGSEVLRQWHADPGPHPASAFVAAVTATVNEGARDKLYRLGFHHYLPKPVQKEKLLETLRLAAEFRKK